MKCNVCGSNLTALNTDLPFKVSETTIVIVKGLPIFQCDNGSQFLLGDSVIDRRGNDPCQGRYCGRVGSH